MLCCLWGRNFFFPPRGTCQSKFVDEFNGHGARAGNVFWLIPLSTATLEYAQQPNNCASCPEQTTSLWRERASKILHAFTIFKISFLLFTENKNDKLRKKSKFINAKITSRGFYNHYSVRSCEYTIGTSLFLFMVRQKAKRLIAFRTQESSRQSFTPITPCIFSLVRFAFTQQFIPPSFVLILIDTSLLSRSR